MNKSPAFQMYPKDFLSDQNVAGMTMEERGVYITLLCHCWLENGLTTLEKRLKHICHNPENWKEIWENVKVCFYEKNGKLHHKRLDFEREKQKRWREKSKQGGLKSAKNKALRKGGSQMVDDCLQPNENTAVCSLQSPVFSLQSSTPKNLKHKYMDSVFLTKEEHQKLIDKFGEEKTQEWIENLDNYIGSKGKRYKSHYKTILVWAKKSGKTTGGDSLLEEEAIECSKNSRNFCSLSQGIENKFCKVCARYEERKQQYEDYKHKEE